MVWRREGRPRRFFLRAPITGRDGVALRDLVRGRLEEAGLDYSGVIIVSRRSMIHVGLVVFDTKNEAQARAAYDACKGLVAPAASWDTANTARTWTSWTWSPTSTTSTTTRSGDSTD